VLFAQSESVLNDRIKRDEALLLKNPDDVAEGETFISNLNPNSLEVVERCQIEPSLRGAAIGSVYQFERLGYFCVDPDSTSAKRVFNRTATLRDTWAKVEQKQKAGG